MIRGNASPKIRLTPQGVVPRWIMYLTADQEIAGLNPGKAEILIMPGIKKFQCNIEEWICLANRPIQPCMQITQFSVYLYF